MIVSIQYLRGIAALMVVLSHVAWKGHQYLDDPMGWFRIGNGGVDLFFVISGFIMCHTTARSRGTVRDASMFMAHRFARILPLYWVLTLATLAVFLAMPSRINTSGGRTDIWQSFLLVPTDGKYLIQAGWTLSYEFFFYFLFAAAMLLGRRWAHPIVAAALVLLVAAGQEWPPHSVGALFATDALLVEFAYGIALYHLVSAKLTGRLTGILSIIAGLVGFALVNADLFHPKLRCFRLGVPALLVCYGVVCFEQDLRRHAVERLKALGDSSYSLYLMHPFPLAAAAPVLAVALHHAFAPVFVLALVLCSTVCGWLVYLWIEARLTRLSKPWVERLVLALSRGRGTDPFPPARLPADAGTASGTR